MVARSSRASTLTTTAIHIYNAFVQRAKAGSAVNGGPELKSRSVQIRASDDDSSVVLKATLLDQLGSRVLNTFAMAPKSGQRIVVKSAKMVSERFHRYSTLESFLVRDGGEPDDFSSVMVVPFVSKEFDVHFVSPFHWIFETMCFADSSAGSEKAAVLFIKLRQTADKSA